MAAFFAYCTSKWKGASKCPHRNLEMERVWHLENVSGKSELRGQLASSILAFCI